MARIAAFPLSCSVFLAVRIADCAIGRAGEREDSVPSEIDMDIWIGCINLAGFLIHKASFSTVASTG